MKLLDRLLGRTATAAAVPEPTGPARHYEVGYTLYWSDWSRRRLTGHWRADMKRGDIVFSKLVSGKRGVFRVVEYEWVNDPELFHVTVEDLGVETAVGSGAFIGANGESIEIPPDERPRGYFV